MQKQQIIKYQKQFLLLNAFILIPIALFYGFIPEGSFDMLFGVEVNASHQTFHENFDGLVSIHGYIMDNWKSIQ